MSMFRLDASIRTEGSVSREVADTVQRHYTEQHPNATVTRRDLVADPLPGLWPVAAGAGFVPEEQRTDEQRAALAVTAGLADEVLRADVVVVATPLYNFGVPSHLKAWIDLLITDPRFGPGTSPLAGRPVTLVVARGGGYGAGTPREGWDHATPYLRRILADVWGADLTVVEAELTLAPVTPAMAELVPLAEASRAQAHEHAAAAGKAA
ncbi:NAD(P)H-dependent oxidoreductase [Pseudonocardia sp.]|uniref:FMN-dependent NADH-azoreductase n=1 Tax=Pseudonocardia sp. TaxID=60912 RepID=UPI002604A8AB|nr:NAD(P)H-dependent oxidoreductase [Pseudonocardia sp.]